jgi:DNA-binding beta-propeller fold protein YncE
MKKHILFILLSLVIGINGFYGNAYGGLFEEKYIFVNKWNGSVSVEGSFHRPNGVAVSLLGNIYVSDTGNHRIQKFTKNGDFVMSWGSAGSGDGQFDYPQGLAVDLSGNVYVADAGNKRIQKFSANGAFITAW